MNNLFSVAIVGCGMIAGRFQSPDDSATYSHAKAILENEAFGEIGFYDHHPERAVEMATKYAGRAFNSIEEMVSAILPSVLVICSSDSAHFEQVKELLESPDCPQVLFVEKPICTMPEQLKILQSLAKKRTDVKIFVNHSRRFDQRHQEVATMIRDGRFGRLDFTRIDYYGGWKHNGVHLVDFLSLCFDSDIIVENAYYACESRYQGDETIHIEGSMDGIGISFRGHEESFYQVTEIDLFFEQGRVLITDFGMRFDVFSKGINNEQENVLFIDEHHSGKAMYRQISTAYEELSQYLSGHRSEILEGVTIESAANIMKRLWKIRTRYEELSN
jgi:predicted dehydrogenase